MANTDILNPVTGWSYDLGFNPNWSYGSPKGIAANYSTARPRFGMWSSRATGDAGPTFDLTFVGPIEQMRYLERFYKQFQRGFFTLIDYDDDSREYVGRFTKYKDNIEQKNAVYVAHATFECIPGVPMRNYPSDFTKWGYPLYVVGDDVGSPYATSATGSQVGTYGANWTLQQTLAAVAAGAAVTDPSGYCMMDTSAAAGDFAVFEYIGWGFQATFPATPSCGLCNILVDGFVVVNDVDLYAATSGSTPGPYAVSCATTAAVGATPAFFTLTITDLPLGTHRVKVLAVGVKNASSSNTSIYMPSITVMG